jgi:hypothetical protein
MIKWTALSHKEHNDFGFRPRNGFAFAKKQQVIEVVMAELSSVIPSYACGFVKDSSESKLVAILGLGSQRNYYVDHDSKWLCEYVPSGLRGYPFTFVENPGQSEKLDEAPKILCIDTDYLSQEMDATPLFSDGGEISPALAGNLEFLNSCDINKKQTRIACNALESEGLIEPWEIKIKASGDEILINDLSRINEAALNQIGAAKLCELRDCGALTIAFGQLFSMNQLAQLSARSAHLNLEMKSGNFNDNIEGIFENQSETLNFENF